MPSPQQGGCRSHASGGDNVVWCRGAFYTGWCWEAQKCTRDLHIPGNMFLSWGTVPNCEMENTALLFFPYAKFFYFAERELRTCWPSCTTKTHRSTAIQWGLTVCPHHPKNLRIGTDCVGGLLTHCSAALLRWELLRAMANSIKGPAEHLNAGHTML